MLAHAEANNARLRKVFPKGFALDATHRPHVTLLQRFVRTAELDRVHAAAAKVFAGTDVPGLRLQAYKYYYIPSGAIGLAGIVARPSPELRELQLALIDVWYRNFHGFTSRSVAPYHQGLKRLPAYLQQLEMESNGKRVSQQGDALSLQTAPVLWGEPGTNGQHAFFQMLHQGTDRVPVEFVVVRRPSHALAGHHDLLLANALAQAQALMQGQADAGGHRHFPGNRPSTFLVLDALTPESLGALLALQEHRVFVSGSLWGLNSFDQWGVELGKVLARDLAPRLQSGDATGLDGSTAGLLRHLRGDVS